MKQENTDGFQQKEFGKKKAINENAFYFLRFFFSLFFFWHKRFLCLKRSNLFIYTISFNYIFLQWFLCLVIINNYKGIKYCRNLYIKTKYIDISQYKTLAYITYYNKSGFLRVYIKILHIDFFLNHLQSIVELMYKYNISLVYII